MIPKRELRGFWSDARTKPPFFSVIAAEVAKNLHKKNIFGIVYSIHQIQKIINEK